MDVNECGEPGPTVTATVRPRPPGAVTLPGTCVNGKHIVRWPAVAGADGYELRRRAAGGWSTDYTGAKPETTLALDAGTSYSFQVRACLGPTNCGAWSDTATLAAAACLRLAPPAELRIDATDPDDYTVRWDAVDGAARYELQESTDSGATWATTHSLTDPEKSLSDQTADTYQYRVRACPAAGDCGEYAAAVSVTVPIPPPAPANLAATEPDADGDYTVSWGAVSFGNNVTYVLEERSPDSATQNVEKQATDTDTSRAIADRSAGDHTYRVRACAGPGNCGDWSDALTVTVGGGEHEWDLSAEYEPHTHRIRVSWSGDPDYARYELRQTVALLVPTRPNTPTPTIPLRSTIQAGADTSHVTLNPLGNTRYAYEIRGCNSASDCGDWSAPITVDVRELRAPFADRVPLGTTTAPGNLPYDTGVTRAGDAYVNVPIAPAPGVAGLAPRLSLDYGGGSSPARRLSDAPGDSLGHGWRVSGFSKIYRCLTNQADVSSLSLTASDALCLDGEPLVRVSGTHLAPGSHYRTLRETFVKLELKGSTMEPSWFEAVFPDGTVRQYGNTADSRLEVPAPSGRQEPLMWSVNRETDALGNAMTYAYSEDETNAVRHPVRIDYGAGADATVRFWYMGREDTETVSTGTLNRQQHLLLHRVEIWLSDKKVREYRLGSALDQGRRRLTGIQVCGFDETGGSAECLDAFGVQWPTSGSATELTGVTDPMGRKTTFEYGSITVSGGDAALDERPFGNPTGTVDGTEPLVADESAVGAPTRSRRVVSAVSRDNGIGGRHRTLYAYQGKGLRSTRNWGELGFHATRVTDEASGVVTYYQYRHDFPYLAEVSAVHQYDGDYGETGTQILSRRETSYATRNIARPTGPGKFPYIDAQTEFLYEGGVQIGTVCTTNGVPFKDGLPKRAIRTTVVGHGPAPRANPPGSPWGTVQAYTPSGVQRKTVSTVDFSNRTSGGDWLIGFTERSEMTYHKTFAGRAERTVDAEFEPHGDSVLVGTETRFPDNAELKLKTGYKYDATGNVLSVQVSGANIDPRAATASNFVSSRYPGTLTNAVGHEETLTYDARFGAVKTLTDANDRVTRLAYDVFGRETRRTTPDGVAITTTYADCGTCPKVGTATAVMTVRTSSSIAPDTTRYLDELGRTIRTETVAFGKTGKRTQDIQYDAQGRVHQVSEPYHAAAGVTAHWTTYIYDVRDRVTAETRPDDGSVTTAYTRSGNGVRVTRTEIVKETLSATRTISTTQRKVSRYNVLGELVETVDAQGATPTVTTAYTYDASGLLDTVTVDGVRETDFDHDDAGNRDAVESPNFGRVTFAHTALGELRRRTDAKNQATGYTYDKLGRLLSVTDGAGWSRWTYDPPNGSGFLKQRCRATKKIDHCDAVGAYRETFGYDSDARLSTRTTRDPRRRDDALVRAQLRLPGGRPPEYRRLPVGAHRAPYLQHAGATCPGSSTTRTAPGSRPTAPATPMATSAPKPTATPPAASSPQRVPSRAGTGRVTGIDTKHGSTSIQDNDYRWRTNGILTRRTAAGGLAETFAYDGLNRLLTATTKRKDATPALRTLTNGYGHHRRQARQPGQQDQFGARRCGREIDDLRVSHRRRRTRPGRPALRQPSPAPPTPSGTTPPATSPATTAPAATTASSPGTPATCRSR